VLEVGSGSGQHAEYFSDRLPHLNWQPSDQEQYLPGLIARCTQAKHSNLRKPLLLDVLANEWPAQRFDAIYSANTLHIMPWQAVEAFFKGVGKTLQVGGQLIVYGPFKYDGGHTSNSNQQFDLQLRSRDCGSAIRDFEAVNSLAESAEMGLASDYEMPANNRCLVWVKN